ncbi:hypothetical protein F7Q99_38805 [Streptomyces kaniharaensis]|uniref:Uncharacterized protein n=1 Tax=Streptomyces kaniharaensis TaxID=212423 RepID=A0A6N7L636_9ACTN|nr:hypothetical protein [Streptomyces kaniharaensis]MQS17984.1 hypothetical protein [Streptomyces kaniharaensis]
MIQDRLGALQARREVRRRLAEGDVTLLASPASCGPSARSSTRSATGRAAGRWNWSSAARARPPRWSRRGRAGAEIRLTVLRDVRAHRVAVDGVKRKVVPFTGEQWRCSPRTAPRGGRRRSRPPPAARAACPAGLRQRLAAVETARRDGHRVVSRYEESRAW